MNKFKQTALVTLAGTASLIYVVLETALRTPWR